VSDNDFFGVLLTLQELSLEDALACPYSVITDTDYKTVLLSAVILMKNTIAKYDGTQ